MAIITTRFDIAVTVSSPAVAKGLSEDNRGALFRKPKVDKSKSKEAGAVGTAQSAVAEEEDVSLSLVELSEGYTELIDRADSILDKLVERNDKLVFEFDPNEFPALSESVAAIFQGVNDRIDYKMYVAALKLDKDIAVQIGEAENGIIR
jgi:hypothetical protein